MPSFYQYQLRRSPDGEAIDILPWDAMPDTPYRVRVRIRPGREWADWDLAGQVMGWLAQHTPTEETQP